MNALTKFHGTAVGDVASLNERLNRNAANRPQGGGGGADLLRLDQNSGMMVYGIDSIEVEEGSKWAVNPYALSSGWVCWADPRKNNRKNEKLGEVMTNVLSDAYPLDRPQLSDAHAAVGGDWKEQVAFSLICIDGEDEGTEVLFSNSSGGAIDAWSAIYEALLDRPSVDHAFPIVEVTTSSYHNKTYNKTIYKPVFDIVDWANQEQELLKGASPVPAVEKNSDAAEVSQAETAPEPAPEAEKTTVRRRRRAV